MKSLAIVIACFCWTTAALAASPPKVVNAADGIFTAFQTHPLVGLGEWHGLAQEEDFYAVLVRDPRFAKEVGNIVLESGVATHQALVDRYVNGENVPYRELRKVWSDGVVGVGVAGMGAANLYAAIRAVNQSLPPESRIKVWLGEPPIDWSQIKVRADWVPFQQGRDSHLMTVLEQEILSKGRKALVIYGAAHFGVYPGGFFPQPSPFLQPNVRFRLDSSHPGALYFVLPYVGNMTAECMNDFERNLHDQQAPAFLSPVRGSTLEEIVKRADCMPLPKPSELTPEQWEAQMQMNNGATANAFLYLGPRKSLLTSPGLPDLYLDLEFRAEIDRRVRLRFGSGLPAPDPASNPVTAQPYEKLLTQN